MHSQTLTIEKKIKTARPRDIRKAVGYTYAALDATYNTEELDDLDIVITVADSATNSAYSRKKGDDEPFANFFQRYSRQLKGYKNELTHALEQGDVTLTVAYTHDVSIPAVQYVFNGDSRKITVVVSEHDVYNSLKAHWEARAFPFYEIHSN